GPGPNDAVAASGWYNQASSGTDGVEVDVSASDPSGVTHLSCTDDQTTVLDTPSASGSFMLTDGTHSISCTATDGAGNEGAGEGQATYTVVYRFLGFSSPIPNSRWQAGRTIPVKFRLGDVNGTRISDQEAQAIASSCRGEVLLTGPDPSPAIAAGPICAGYD